MLRTIGIVLFLGFLPGLINPVQAGLCKEQKGYFRRIVDLFTEPSRTTTQSSRLGKSNSSNNERQLKIWELIGSGNNKEAETLRSQLEKTLLTEPIIAIEELGGGITPSYLITLKSGLRAVYKPNASEYSNSHAEVAAYEIAKMMGLERVPVTVERQVHSELGSVEFFLEKVPDGKMYEEILMRDFFKLPEKERRNLAFFDFLTANGDRNPGNYLILELPGGEQWIIAIDHGRLFEYASGKQRSSLPNHCIPTQSIYERLVAMDPVLFREKMKNLMTLSQLNAFLSRRSLIIKDIEKRRAMFGDDKVFGIQTATP